MREPDADELAARLLRRERDAVAPALDLVDDRRAERRRAAQALLDRLEREAGDGGARRIGLTGPPGAGKSTLLDALVREIRARERTVGIIAVDPSSRRSGGALLGDRFRMRAGARDRGVFLRSMAARERLGGLADAAQPGVTVLSAVFDFVFVETVGVGQSESDIARVVDTVVYVAQPGAGDVLQYMKAGLLELPDVFAVNKADVGGMAERTAGELSSGLGLSGGEEAGGWKPPVLLVSARDGRGLDALVDALERHRQHLEAGPGLARRRREARLCYLHESLARRYGTFGLERIGGEPGLEERLDAAGDACVFGLAETLGQEIEKALATPA